MSTATFKGLIIAAAALAATTTAHAQTATASAQNQLKLIEARRLVQALGPDSGINQATAEVNATVMTELERAAPAGDSQRAGMLTAAGKLAVANMQAQVAEATAAAYAANFTVEQLQAMSAFFASSAGKALLERREVVTRQSATLARGLLPDVFNQTASSYCKQVTCTAAEWQAFATLLARAANEQTARP
ncbi:DUF2059 domain-containing protein [Caulobacter segnis]|uniref:DUF2059 domain-containing protein n=1 Tax=Caulobacter segnis TaxID=88688 RepID=UPI00240F380B|nr:DUF2059 domain-containing protein [Caulobacter segnis]MDG2520737.1 DUF2059 domain-containing protein [Caulobacter segnis]